MAAPVQLQELPNPTAIAVMEKDVMKHWALTDAARTAAQKSAGRPLFVVCDSPPLPVRYPVHDDLLKGALNDTLCRHAYQTGHHVVHRPGWVCHGIGVEHNVDRASGKEADPDTYSTRCREYTTRIIKEWEDTSAKFGRWADFSKAYQTSDLPYMESVWWGFKSLWDKDLVYRAARVLPYSTACAATVSRWEAGMNYRDASIPGAAVAFPFLEDPATRLVAWTDTPWTLTANLALAVCPDVEYLKVIDTTTGHFLILAEQGLTKIDGLKKKRSSETKPQRFQHIGTVRGRDLEGKRYRPPFDFLLEHTDAGAFRVLCDANAARGEMENGTGVAHLAPAFQQQALLTAQAHGIVDKSVPCPIDDHGRFTAQAFTFEGKLVTTCDRPVLDAIDAQGQLVATSKTIRSVPCCLESNTPLIHRAVDAWFVRVEGARARLAESASGTRWITNGLAKRFADWLKGAHDWDISRNGRWGTPLPVWHSTDWDEVVCVGSAEELQRLSGCPELEDLHRHSVDSIVIPSRRPGHPPLRRVPHILGGQFDVAAAPYAQWHYPFENKDLCEAASPADLVIDGLHQTRGLFYTALIHTTFLMDRAPFKTVVATGPLTSPASRFRMSLRHEPPVADILDTHGADALRLYLLNCAAVQGEPVQVRPDGVKELRNTVLISLSNVLNMFVMGANHHLAQGGAISLDRPSAHMMDRWVSATAQSFAREVRADMAACRLRGIVPSLSRFIDALSSWYLRLNRTRLKGMDGMVEAAASLCTLLSVLFTTARVIAPFVPFFAETMFQTIRPLLPLDVRAEDSVHYLMAPEPTEAPDAELLASMALMTSVVHLGRSLRERCGVPLRTPFRRLVVVLPQSTAMDGLMSVIGHVQAELNTLDIGVVLEADHNILTHAIPHRVVSQILRPLVSEFLPPSCVRWDTPLDAARIVEALRVSTMKPNSKVLGHRLKKALCDLRLEMGTMAPEQVRAFVADGGGVVGGHSLTMDDVVVTHSCGSGGPGAEIATDGSVFILADTSADSASVIDARRVNCFIAQLQQARHRASVRVMDPVDVFYDAEPPLAAALSSSSKLKSLPGSCRPGVPGRGRTVLGTESMKVEGMAVVVTLVVPNPSQSTSCE